MNTSRKVSALAVGATIGGRLAFITVYATATEVYQAVAHTSMHLPIAIPALLGTALSILLGFKTNAAYDRWWEARKIWGAIVNDSRTFARQVLSLISPRDASDADATATQHRELVHRQIAWCYSLTHSLRGQDSLKGLEGLLSAGEREQLERSANRPNAILQIQGEQIRSALDVGRLDSIRFLPLEGTLSRLTDHMGMCERIKNTVFPAHYGYLVSRMIWLFCLLLPWGLVDSMGWVTVPVTFFTAAAFWMIECIGFALVDPFENRDNDTPMTALSRTIEIDLRQQLGETDVPGKLVPVDDVLM